MRKFVLTMRIAIIILLHKKSYSQKDLAYYLTIIRRSRGEYFPIITEPEVNNCFSIFTQVILILFISLSVICTKRRLVAIL